MTAMEIDAATGHPNPIPNSHHRKVELQSPLDLTYLQANIAASARQKLDLHFPSNASQPVGSSGSGTAQDPMRQRVQELVDQFLAETWASAAHSISINGLDATEVLQTTTQGPTPTAKKPKEEREGVDFEYEPFDSRLSTKLATLHGELEALTSQVSKLRRTAPAQAAEKYRTALMASLDDDEKTHETEKERAGKIEGEEGLLRLDDIAEGWQEDISAMYEHGLAELRRLGGQGGGEGSGSLTETVGKVQRAKVVALELE